MDEIRKHIVEMAGGLVPVSSESFINPVSDYKNFRQLMVSSEQIVIDAADQIIDALPKMPDDTIERVISTVAVLSKKLWYLRAACVAELLKRQLPSNIGGRGKKSNGDGRNEFVKKWSEELKIKPTKLREDMRIAEVFGEHFYMDRQSGVLEKVSNEDEKRPLVLNDYERERISRNSLAGKMSIKSWDIKQTVKTSRDGEFIEDVAFVSNDNEIKYAAHFSPHPMLNRQHYVVMSKMRDIGEAKKKEWEVIRRIEGGENLTAVKLNEEIFIKSDKQESFFKLRRDGRYWHGKLEVTLIDEDFETFNQMIELSLGIKDFNLSKSLDFQEILAESGNGYEIITKAFQAYLYLLKTDQAKWGVERNFDPANFTEQRRRIKHEAASQSFSAHNKYRLSKEKLKEIEAKIEDLCQNLEPDHSIRKEYEKQLKATERAKVDAEFAHEIYLAEENFQLEKVAELREKAEKAKNKKKNLKS